MKSIIWLLFGLTVICGVQFVLESDKVLSEAYQTQALVCLVGAVILSRLEKKK